MDHPRGRGALGQAHELPGRLARFANPVLHDAAPVRGVENAEGSAHLSLGQRDRSAAFGDAILPPTHDHGSAGLATVLASLCVLGLLGLSLALVTGQGWDADYFGAQAVLGGVFAMPMTNDPLTQQRTLPFGQCLGDLCILSPRPLPGESFLHDACLFGCLADFWLALPAVVPLRFFLSLSLSPLPHNPL